MHGHLKIARALNVVAGFVLQIIICSLIVFINHISLCDPQNPRKPQQNPVNLSGNKPTISIVVSFEALAISYRLQILQQNQKLSSATMVSTHSTIESSEMPFSAESHMTSLSPTPVSRQVASTTFESEPGSPSGQEDDMEEEDEEAEIEDEEVEEEDDEEAAGGLVEEEGYGEILEEVKDWRQSNEAVAVKQAQTVANPPEKLCKISDFASTSSMMMRRTVFQDFYQLPPLSKSKSETRKRKWLDVDILETEAFIKMLAVLQEEYSLYLSVLKKKRDRH